MGMKKSSIAQLGILAAMMGGGMGGFGMDEANARPTKYKRTPRPTVQPIPKGCERFYYNDEGLCSKGEEKVYFDAMKPSNAHTKYLKWKEAQK